jgi:lipopolysaccharide transport system ATP-binding protein
MQTVASNDSSSMILVEDVRKVYRLGQTPLDPLRVALGLRPHRAHSEHRAVDGISLDIKKGETVGILGVNGAGKSTLLQMITGTLRPTSGKVQTFGRIAALLELGAGFNPQWTGRKNAEFQCVLQGVPATELSERIAAIEAFADIGDYFDEPARTYSSGMYVRVAFACSVASEPDILIVDEALAVGDVRFQNKCFRRFEEMQAKGCTVLFVTHSTDLVTRFCSRCLVLQAGQIVFDGLPRDGVRNYLNLLYGLQDESSSEPEPGTDGEQANLGEVDLTVPAPSSGNGATQIPRAGAISERSYYNAEEVRSGSGKGRIRDVILTDAKTDGPLVDVESGTRLRLRVAIELEEVYGPLELGMIVRSAVNQILCGATNIMLGKPVIDVAPREPLWIVWEFDANFMPGDYFIDLGVSELVDADRAPIDWRQSIIHLMVRSQLKNFGAVKADITFSLMDPTPTSYENRTSAVAE